MRKPEQKACDALRKGIVQPGDRWDRVENLLQTGTPDVNACLSAKELWIEVKAPAEPKRASTPLFGSNHKLEQDQANWIKRQKDAGGNVFIYIETEKHRILLDGAIGDTINTLTLNQIRRTALWWSARPMKEERWRELRKVLMS